MTAIGLQLFGTDEAALQVLCSVLGPSLQDIQAWEHVQRRTTEL